MSTFEQHPLFTSRSEEWGTPQELFDNLDMYYEFTLDPCAAPWNHKCDRYFTVEDNGLEQSWANERVFMNPPYGRGIDKWMEKAYNESKYNRAFVIVLVHARTDTNWWHDWAMRATKIWLINGRMTFDDTDGTPADNPAPFPSCVIMYEPHNLDRGYVPVQSMNRRGERTKER
jgi:site-specific DNA-methyltransferase (adenine-specific)